MFQVMKTVLRVVHAFSRPPLVRVEVGRPRGPPRRSSRRRTAAARDADVLQRVEHLGADVLAAVLVAGRDRAADLAVVGPLAASLTLAGVRVEPLDDQPRQRALVAEPDRAGDAG